MYYIGIDLGTSAVKLLLVNEKGEIVNSVSKDYPLYFPASGWSQQEPSDWWKAVSEGLDELLEKVSRSEVRTVGCGGQMHGLVILDENDEVIRPCILWNDGRTDKQTAYLNEVIGKDKLNGYTANIAFAGFTAPKILWVRDNEPENFKSLFDMVSGGGGTEFYECTPEMVKDVVEGVDYLKYGKYDFIEAMQKSRFTEIAWRKLCAIIQRNFNVPNSH